MTADGAELSPEDERPDPLPLVHDHEVPRVLEFRRRLVEAIPCPDGARAREALLAMPLRDVILAYVNFAERLVPPRPRTLHFLDEFGPSMRGCDVDRVAEVVLEIQSGIDLGERLSDQVRTHGYVPPKTRGGRRRRQWLDKDLALNAFGIHHLHLGERTRDGRVRRTDQLVFCSFYRSDAVLLACGTHRSFQDGTLVRLGGRLRAATGWVMQGILTPEPPDPRDILKAARHGIGTLDVIDGQVVPTAMLATSGHRLEAVRHTNLIIETLLHVEARLGDAAYLADVLQLPREDVPSAPAFSWEVEYTDLLLVEHVSRRRVRLVQGRS